MELGPGQIAQLICIIVMIFLSAFFSASETALVTVNKIRMKNLAEAGSKRAERVLQITSDSNKMLSTILIGNNIVNLTASSLATLLVTDICKQLNVESLGPGLATGLLTLLILIFGEITPKTMATLKADAMSLAIAGIIETLMFVLTPIIFIVGKLSRGVLFLLRVKETDADKVMTEDEIRSIVDESQESGVIEDEEREMIHNVFDFGDSLAKEVMVPRIDMSFLHVDATYDEVLAQFRQDKFTRVPVYEESTDSVIGMVNMKDLLLIDDIENFSIRNILRDVYFTFEHKHTSDLLVEMRDSSISLAIVLDEYGVTAGLVTMEDLLEEIVGEIRDEYDTDEVDSIMQIGEREYMVLATTNLDDVSDELGVAFSSDDYDTIGGYCLELLDHLPEKNEIVFTEDGVLLKIEEIDKNRIERISIKLPAPENEDE